MRKRHLYLFFHGTPEDWHTGSPLNHAAAIPNIKSSLQAVYQTLPMGAPGLECSAFKQLPELRFLRRGEMIYCECGLHVLTAGPHETPAPHQNEVSGGEL